MKYNDFDTKLKDMLNAASSDIPAPDDMLDKIKNRAESGIYKEAKTMKLNMKFKIAIVAAAICVFSVTGYAIGQISSWESHSYIEDIPYTQISELEEKAGFEIKSVEKFQNGFEYVSAGIGKTQATDDNGGIVGESNNINISYENDDRQAVILGARHVINGEDLSIVDKYEVHKTVIYPGGDESKIDPEEVAQYEADGYWVSYGTVDEKTEQTYESYYWLDGDILYNIGGIDTNIGEEGFIQMQKEIMES